jgi:Fe-S-cluster containining protein
MMMKMNRSLHLESNLIVIARQADEKQEENDAFRTFLRMQPGNVDLIVHALNDEIEPQIDCTKCGNCCRSLMINVKQEEAIALADHFNESFSSIKEKYLEQSVGGQFIINTIPCHFLTENKCSIYEQRFEDCRAFPHLYKDGFTDRLFGTFMHYGRCPIIYNVVEALKFRTGFLSPE